MISFVVNGPPVPMARARVFQRSNGRMGSANPAKSTAYKKLVAQIATAARAAWEQITGARWSLDAPAYWIELRVYREARRGDWDNFGKAISDACQGVLWGNDGRIEQASVGLFVDKHRPRIEVSCGIAERRKEEAA